MSAVATIPRYMGFGAPKPNTAVSDAARLIVEDIEEAIDDSLTTATALLGPLDSIRKLSVLYAEYRVPNWGGYGEAPISAEACREARAVLARLPAGFPGPEFIPEPAGSIALEWRNANRLYMVSVTGKGSIEFAKLFGPGNESHGRYSFSDFLPEEISTDLSRLYRG